jgi:hypothetical protein
MGQVLGRGLGSIYFQRMSAVASAETIFQKWFCFLTDFLRHIKKCKYLSCKLIFSASSGVAMLARGRSRVAYVLLLRSNPRMTNAHGV